jgi:hypothetical protein
VTILMGHGRRVPAGSPAAQDRLASELQPNLPLSLALEMMAQVALVVLTRDPDRDGPPMGLLAGISEARVHGASRVTAGDRLVGTATLKGRFGRAVKVLCRIDRPEPGGAGSWPIAEAELLLSFEE